MVQVSLKKWWIWVGGVTILLTLAIWIVLGGDSSCHDHAHEDVEHWSLPDDDVSQSTAPPRPVYKLDSAQRTELKGIYAEIIQAYSNRQVDVLRTWRQKLPGRVELLSSDDLDDVGSPLFRIVYDELYTKLEVVLRKKPLEEEFGGVTDFERRAVSLISLTRLYGDVLLQRGNFGRLYECLEPFMFRRLKYYKDCFHAAGQKELEESADRLLTEWIDQIESENGYTRTLLVHWLNDNRRWRKKLMFQLGQSWEKISQNTVRQAVTPLIQAGYTPKWLDEFQPNEEFLRKKDVPFD